MTSRLEALKKEHPEWCFNCGEPHTPFLGECPYPTRPFIAALVAALEEVEKNLFFRKCPGCGVDPVDMNADGFCLSCGEDCIVDSFVAQMSSLRAQLAASEAALAAAEGALKEAEGFAEMHSGMRDKAEAELAATRKALEEADRALIRSHEPVCTMEGNRLIFSAVEAALQRQAQRGKTAEGAEYGS